MGNCGYLALALALEFAVERGVFDAIAPVFRQRVGQLAFLLENLPKCFIHVKIMQGGRVAAGGPAFECQIDDDEYVCVVCDVLDGR